MFDFGGLNGLIGTPEMLVRGKSYASGSGAARRPERTR
jgi:hypothetical protein